MPSPAPHDGPDNHAAACTMVEQLNDRQIEDVYRLMRQQWWGRRRTLDQVRTMVAHSSLTIALAEQNTGRIVGFARTLTDFVFRATIYDVMVDTEFQQRGFGRQLLDSLCSHPRLQAVSLIYLACDPDLFSFYQQWGFEVYDERAHWMIRVQQPES
ncbi:MAG: GNAT family N-acetyltransferase [Planctomycetaceae bacterium]|nr:GNAT family N-acetyltransferase [Planctomycetaceae bacterium]